MSFFDMRSVVYVSCRWFEQAERCNLFYVGRTDTTQQMRGMQHVLESDYFVGGIPGDLDRLVGARDPRGDHVRIDDGLQHQLVREVPS